MLKRLSAALMAVALTLSVAGSAFAYSGPTPWPGRPIRFDGTGDQCQALAWARVDGQIVLLSANHCQASAVEGQAAYTNGNVVMGHYGVMNSSWKNNDLIYIVPVAAYKPSSGLNVIYGGVSNWTVTRNPLSGDGCAGYVSGKQIEHDAQQNWTSTWASVIGTETSKFTHTGGCGIYTSIHVSGNGIVDSGSPFGGPIPNPNTVVGITTGCSGPDCGNTAYYLYFNPVYQGLDAMNTYFVNLHGTGAWLCQTSTC